ncbi:carbonic anhydrase [Oleiphilus messinensis]|uniref:Carbonic anhydrase n=1 Tax=Oleiphilus messinensis TaxID=141451 RepID=A0A1Y0ICM9_9GAMM|nr:gamma carbonic anhydrase family protein [Oleiphilus messinensis]ARU57536.1 carbonic anhydrase [Oleiphilus messinensis]
MIYQLGPDKVEVHEEVAFIADNATVIGNAVISKEASIWFNAVVRADCAKITVGPRTNVQDAAVLHADEGFPCVLGEGVTVGHHATVHGCEVGDFSLIGINAVVLNGAKIGKYCLIGSNTLIPEKAVIPDGSLVVGSPGKVKRALSAMEQKILEVSADHYVKNGKRYKSSLELQAPR